MQSSKRIFDYSDNNSNLCLLKCCIKNDIINTINYENINDVKIKNNQRMAKMLYKYSIKNGHKIRIDGTHVHVFSTKLFNMLVDFYNTLYLNIFSQYFTKESYNYYTDKIKTQQYFFKIEQHRKNIYFKNDNIIALCAEQNFNGLINKEVKSRKLLFLFGSNNYEKNVNYYL